MLQKLGILTPGTSIGLQLQLLPLATGLQVYCFTFPHITLLYDNALARYGQGAS